MCAFRRLLLIGIVVFFASACDKPPKKAAPLASQIELTTGNVDIKSPGGKWERALSGGLLRVDSEIRVGAGDRALIRLDSGSAVFLRQGTKVRLDAEGVTLTRGELWIDAPHADQQTAKFKAGDVVVSAADAGFDLRYEEKKATIYVARGLAVVSALGGRSEVQAGERAIVVGKGSVAVDGVAFWEDWTGGMADQPIAAGTASVGSGRIYAIDRGRPGSPPKRLEVRTQRVQVTIRDGVARTTVDQTFFNPNSEQLEGYYWFTVPEQAAVDRFALQVDNALVEGEVTERKEAAAAYESAVRSAFDPALLEWIDGRTYRARVFPIPPTGERRVVMSYTELLPTVDQKTNYVYPMGTGAARVQEFSLDIDLGSRGKKLKLFTSANARVEGGGERVTMRRSGFKPHGDFLLEMIQPKSKSLRVFRVSGRNDEADYVMLRYTPDVDWSAVKQVQGDVVVVVDTSVGGDDTDRQLRRDVAEAVLRALSKSDRFALVAADIKPRVLYPQKGLATANAENVKEALQRLASITRGGATDLGRLFDVALKRLHGAQQPALLYIGDGQPTVGEIQGDALVDRLSRSMADAAARLFTIAVGAVSNHALLGRLARMGGGAAARVDIPEQAVQEALRFVGALKTPTMSQFKFDIGAGLDQAFSSAAAKVTRGQEVVLLARTHHQLPRAVKVSGLLGGSPFEATHRISVKKGAAYAYVPKLWARRYLDHLLAADSEANRGTIIRLGIDYALMTPFTSFLVLENDAAYQRYGIERRPRNSLWGTVPHAAVELLAAVPLSLFGCGRTESDTQVERSEPHYKTKQSPRNSISAQPAVAPAPKEMAEQTASPSSVSERRMRTLSKVAKSAARESTTIDADRLGLGTDGLEGNEKFKRDGNVSDVMPVQTVKVCSDASQLSLPYRRALWARALDRNQSVNEWIHVYRKAYSRCELPHWTDKKALLNLIQERVHTANQVNQLLTALPSGRARIFVRGQLLKRAFNAQFAAVLDGGEGIDWRMADAALAQLVDPMRRVAQMRTLCASHPQSRGCTLRLIQALVAANLADEALTLALKARDQGVATPLLMQATGDLLAASGRVAEAIRSYSEIVEYAPTDPAARQLLGDIYLRHGWYEPAFAQYKTLVQMRSDVSLAQLRLAAAAAGCGRTDQALRLQRKVAGAEGEPGLQDPRRIARLLSAMRLAQLIASTDMSTTCGGGTNGEVSHKGKPTKQTAQGKCVKQRANMQRALMRLQVFGSSGSGALVLVNWEDLATRLQLEIANASPSAEYIDAGISGLYAVSLRTPQVPERVLIKRIPDATARSVRFTVTIISSDGKQVRVNQKSGVIPPRAETPVEMELP